MRAAKGTREVEKTWPTTRAKLRPIVWGSCKMLLTPIFEEISTIAVLFAVEGKPSSWDTEVDGTMVKDTTVVPANYLLRKGTP
jgi:hypothetical protein